MSYEISNKEREYLGLDPIEKHWDKVFLKGDTYRPETILYYEGDTIKRHITSTDAQYAELQYNEKTKDRVILLPKTEKGKEKKLTASVLEQRQPIGVYIRVDNSDLTIGNYTTQTTFYSTRWEKSRHSEKEAVPEIINNFIKHSPENHLKEISIFKASRRKNIKYRPGDYFRFKLNRTEYGFGRLLLDVNKLRKKGYLPKDHGLGLLMGPPLIVQLFAYKSKEKDIAIDTLDKQPKLPSDVMMDNLLLYGEYEVFGHREIRDEELDFPISYGRSIDQRQVVFLQWGLIHRELPKETFNKYVVGEKSFDQNPYGYYSIGFRPHYDTVDVAKAIENEGKFDFESSEHYLAKWDLRNPKNKAVKDEIFKAFSLDPNSNYLENCLLTGTSKTIEI
ncbi:immunity 26/phosphotriesterase HocA family protein [Pontibacter beigongshangensis]|uniref:immunity 26/phosphotriesterase HocA family protein n=1 Tax=Pontibacter beigongshangensis TaxID=2574733 RepID=UPI00164EE1D8|nr:immunity 26/phosphotriesterase HocA family protein [Pontibacter beigongshangensis]